MLFNKDEEEPIVDENTNPEQIGDEDKGEDTLNTCQQGKNN